MLKAIKVDLKEIIIITIKEKSSVSGPELFVKQVI
jgi:hypothetical protein